ncbi:hypothetical protein [Caviibacter abscessus]|uniref:hypothetical protein n=1 Tax=Caviibacter abscessus TaxID=1766719 RepID=UPI00083008E7|nr:hypothetical protein [Caviibacter abscessus]
MNKIISILVYLLISFNILAVEGNIKVGYDFYRGSTNITDTTKSIPYTGGFVIGAEIIPLSYFDNKLKIGAGFEYNFGAKTLHYGKDSTASMLPVYATLKYTYYRKNDLNLYTFGRLGYAFAKEKDPNNNFHYFHIRQNTKTSYDAITSGLYYGLGLGLDYKYFLAEILYDGKFFPYKHMNIRRCGLTELKPAQDFHHKIGIRVGVQLGSQHFPTKQIRCPKCNPRVIEKLVKVEKRVKVPEIVEKIVEVPAKPKKTIKKKRKVDSNLKWDCKLINNK